MGLKWPILLAPVAIGIAVAVFFAFRRSHHGWQGELPYLARSFRLTELPEYQRALRLHERLSIAALVLAIVAVTTLIGAALRPTWTYEPRLPGSDTPHVDIMLCFGPLFSLQFADKTGLAPLMTSLRDEVDGFGNQRIGMTNEFYRDFPVTADHQWVSQRMSEIIEMTDEYLAADFSQQLSLNTGLFERESYGTEPNVVDTLAMCAMGLPAVGSDNGRAKMIIYVGETELLDDPGSITHDTSPPKQIYSKGTLEQTIKAARIQVNTIVPDEVHGAIGFVEKLVSDTGGQQIMYTEVDGIQVDPTPKHLQNQKDELAAAVDKILSNPPPSALDEAREESMRSFQWEVPDILLQIALLAVVGLAACRLGMRL
jgi:Ca-activated chloride channel family protein